MEISEECDASEDLCPIEISSYHPLPYEMNILPVMTALVGKNGSKNLKFNHSLPIVEKKKEPLVFREYQEGDELMKSDIFNLMEPKSTKK
mmetsp:Transcript_18233/g.28047  ORF Transcript_18233/g.28047 Transcript_18233/m.28047 type:complete len:90 (+) Transcript_18233:375-644(+)